MTPEQLNIAAAVRDELLMAFESLNERAGALSALIGICEHYKLPALDGDAMPAVGAAVLALAAAHDAYAEFCAAADLRKAA